MTPEQIALVQRSLEVLRDRSNEFTQRFYAHLFVLNPSARSLFPSDIEELRVKFFAELAAIAMAISDFDRFVARGEELGRAHDSFGVRSTDYRFGGQALVAALGDVFGDELTDDLAGAWRNAYHLVSQVMLGGAIRSSST